MQVHAPVTQTTEAMVSVRGIDVEVLSFGPSSPFSGIFEGDERDVISLSLASPLTQPNGTYLGTENTPGKWNRVGKVSFCPAGSRLLVSALEVVPYRILRVCCRPEFVTDTIGSARDWASARLLAALDLRSPILRRDLLRIAQEVNGSMWSRKELIENMVRITLIEMMRALDETQPPHTDMQRDALAPWQMRRIREYADSLIDHAPSINELAQACELSSRHLMRAFKSSTGRTLGDYLKEVRMLKAKNLLADTHMPLKKIAGRLGYSSPSTFCVAFGKAVGMTPKQYRSQQHGPP